MKTLKACGLVSSRKDGSWTKYTLNKDKMAVLSELIGTLR